MTSQERITDKIRKLLALTESPNENEAALAAERAQELMLKYGIELAQVAAAKDKPIGAAREEFDSKVDPWRRALADSVCRSMGGRMVYWNQPRKWTGGFTFWGQAGTTPGMVALYQYLEAQCLVISAIEASRVQHANAAQSMRWRRSFLIGMVARLGVRLQAQRREVAAQADNSTALVAIGRSVDKAMDDHYGKDGLTTGGGYRPIVDGAAFAAGQAAGRDVDLGAPGLAGQQEIAS